MVKRLSCSIDIRGLQSLNHRFFSLQVNGNSSPDLAGSPLAACSHMGAWPSKSEYCTMSVSAAAASNKRPTELDNGLLMCFCHACLIKPVLTGYPSHSSPCSQHKAKALRQGSRPAFSPPGKRKGRNELTRSHAPGTPNKPSLPRCCHLRRSPCHPK